MEGISDTDNTGSTATGGDNASFTISTSGPSVVPGQTPSTPPTGQAPLDDQEGSTDESETFSRDYVERLRKEAASYRTRAKDAEMKVSAHEKEKMTELEKAQKERDEAKAELADSRTQLANQTIRSALVAKAIALNFHNPDDAAASIKLSDVTVTDEGAPDGRSVTALVAALAKEKPYLVKSVNSGGGDGGPTTAVKPRTQADIINDETKQLVDAGAIPLPPGF